MYRFPEYKNISTLIGKNLVMVCCNANQIYLHFDSNISISIDTNKFQVTSNIETITIGIPIDNLLIFDFIEKKVTKLELNETRTVLEILFEGNKKIILTDDDYYESHVIRIGKKEYFI